MGSVVRRKTLSPSPGDLPPVATLALPGLEPAPGGDGGPAESPEAASPLGSTPQFTPGNTPGAPSGLGAFVCKAH